MGLGADPMATADVVMMDEVTPLNGMNAYELIKAFEREGYDLENWKEHVNEQEVEKAAQEEEKRKNKVQVDSNGDDGGDNEPPVVEYHKPDGAVLEWDEADVVQWLGSLNPVLASTYCSAVMENAINGEMLLELGKDEELLIEGMGVENKLHRMRIRMEINKLQT
eukprot:TRINITY_DN4320_c0_g1_i3.p1 TRINITY_DN4320_c0_g1~~TRINITY_DN4320_c0_g1_i3.p1  ORF type:complete len:165 (+),score=51.19 TRINITY_DN4320_c0_g1_i3:147-641(+)